MIKRSCQPNLSESFFLFGARGTGKSTLVSHLLANKDCLHINLLKNKDEQLYFNDPDILVQQVKEQKPEWVFIDEVQKNVKLLEIVHDIIESPGKTKFALTGSSARKLKQGAADLLAGRAFLNVLFPLTHEELGSRFHLNSALAWGTLPKLLELESAALKAKYLRTYATTYLKEEISQEQLVRKLVPFRKFLPVAAQMSGKLLNFSKISRDVGVDDNTIREYFQILEDTHLGFMLSGFDHSVRKRFAKAPKFYFFDLGVLRALAGHLRLPVMEGTSYYGELFEQFVVLELSRKNAYEDLDFEFFHYRTNADAEIDLVVKRPTKPLALVEIKSSTHVDASDLNYLSSLHDEFGEDVECFCLCQENRARRYKNVRVLPWQNGIQEICS